MINPDREIKQTNTITVFTGVFQGKILSKWPGKARH